jgi:hypothetical protein
MPETVLDTRSWAGRALYFDILALVALLLSVLATALNIYSYLSAEARDVEVTWRLLVTMGFSLVVFILSYSWIAARLVRASVHEAR